MTGNARATLLVTIGVLVGMLTLAFYSPVLYDAFCRVTGFGGTTQVAQKRPEAVLDRKVRVRLDANVGDKSGLVFKAMDPIVDLNVGEIVMVFFEISNPTDRTITANALYNVAPHKTGPYFTKLDCFCFEERQFHPGESINLPVIFFLDPSMDKEHTQDDVTDITLSYTFYEVEKSQENQTARLEPAARRN